jgi:hypothetical protein
VNRTVKGFQAVEIIASGTEGERSYRLEATKDKHNQDCEGRRNLCFEPRRPTNVLEAQLPDTAFNRKILGSTLYYGAEWEVADPEIRKEITKIADEFEKQLAEERNKKPTTEQVILSLDERLRKAEEENIRLQHELKKKKETDVVIDSIKQAPKPEEKKPEEPRVEIGTIREKEIENEVKAEVFKELDVWIVELKKRTNKWWITKEYRQKIHPEIQRRLAERLKAEGTNANVNTGVSVDNKK